MDLLEQISREINLPKLSIYVMRDQLEDQLSFLQYVKLLRIVAAMEMLLNGDKNISEVAYAVGYSNIAAFSNSFQQSVNRRPSDFALLRNKRISRPGTGSRE